LHKAYYVIIITSMAKLPEKRHHTFQRKHGARREHCAFSWLLLGFVQAFFVLLNVDNFSRFFCRSVPHKKKPGLGGISRNASDRTVPVLSAHLLRMPGGMIGHSNLNASLLCFLFFAQSVFS